MTRAVYLAATLAALVIGGAAEAQAPTLASTSLGHRIAATAASAERGTTQQPQIRPAVQSAVQGLIISSGADPKVVVAALDQVIAECHPGGAGAGSGWMCPSSGEAFAALTSLRGTVMALLAAQEPTAIGGSGPAALGGGGPGTSAGADYKSISE